MREKYLLKVNSERSFEDIKVSDFISHKIFNLLILYTRFFDFN